MEYTDNKLQNFDGKKIIKGEGGLQNIHLKPFSYPRRAGYGFEVCAHLYPTLLWVLKIQTWGSILSLFEYPNLINLY